jgi:hypothetical protein
MTPRRTVQEVERSLDASRSELESALADLRVSARQISDIRGQAERYKEEYTERYTAQARAYVEERRDRLTTQAQARVRSDGPKLAVGGAAVSGFIFAGGVSGTVNIPFKLAGGLLGHPMSGSRLEAGMRQDRSTKQISRALVAVAAADRHMRSRRARLWRAIRPTPRRVFLIASAGGGAFVAMADDETVKTVQTEARALAETIGGELAKRIDQIGK